MIKKTSLENLIKFSHEFVFGMYVCFEKKKHIRIKRIMKNKNTTAQTFEVH